MIRESHLNTIYEAHEGIITNQEEFEMYANKMAAVHTVITLLAIENDQNKDAIETNA